MYPDWSRDLTAYLHHERVKSTVVDTVRYAKAIAGGEASPEWLTGAAANLAGKLNDAYPVWQVSTRISAVDAAAALRSHASGS